MFYPIEGGSSVDIQGMLCNMPPVGYIIDYRTTKLKKVGVYKSNNQFTNCIWEPDPRWSEYKKWQQKEKELQIHNKNYKHPELNKFIEEMWLYRMGGFWFYNNDEPTYITGQNWFYLSVFKMNKGALPDYRDADREVFYAWQYSQEDPLSFGLLYVTKRRSGKSFICGCIALELTTRSYKFNTGIQSKTEDDARDFFIKTVVTPYRSLPDFFQPKSNMANSGKVAAKELKFVGSKADDVENELDSMINYKSSGTHAYDGTQLGFYISDEIFKPQDANIHQRWSVVQFCLKSHSGKIIGKTIHTSTVEEIDGSTSSHQKMWSNSDQTNKSKGRTATGMNRIFISADRVKILDKYGRPMLEESLQEIMDERKSKEADKRELSELIKKEPLTIEEAFASDASNCVFSDPIKLNNRSQELIWNKSQYVIGNFEWVNGDRDTAVEFIECPNGRCKVMYLPPDHLRNLFIIRNGRKFPNNTSLFRMGCDPFDYKMEQLADKKRMSKGSIWVKKCEDPIHHSIVDFGGAAMYLSRPSDPDIFYEDVLKMAFFYGSYVLFERNKSKIADYFEVRGYQDYLFWIPGEPTRGIYNSAQTKGGGVNGKIAEMTDSFINNHIESIFFEEIIDQWMKFTPENTTEFDLAMAFGFAEILDREITRKISKVSQNQIKVSDILSFVD